MHDNIFPDSTVSINVPLECHSHNNMLTVAEEGAISDQWHPCLCQWALYNDKKLYNCNRAATNHTI